MSDIVINPNSKLNGEKAFFMNCPADCADFRILPFWSFPCFF